MAKLTHIQEYGNSLVAIFDDGTRHIAAPTPTRMWVVGGGLTGVVPDAPIQVGNVVTIPTTNSDRITYGDGILTFSPDQDVAISANATINAYPKPGYVIAAGAQSSWTFIYVPPGPDPTGYKFPFPRELIDFESYFGHSGVDWPGGAVGTSAAIKAVGPGNVFEINGGHSSYLGNYCIIDHGDIDGRRIASLYAHMVAPPIVGYGPVVGGQQLGTIGTTGDSTGIHLHLEIIYDWVRLPTSTPGNNTPGLGFQRTLAWMDAYASGSW